jgi:hypothetical protein
MPKNSRTVGIVAITNMLRHLQYPTEIKLPALDLGKIRRIVYMEQSHYMKGKI